MSHIHSDVQDGQRLAESGGVSVRIKCHIHSDVRDRQRLAALGGVSIRVKCLIYTVTLEMDKG